MSKIYLIEGPVGSGKSTFAKKLALEVNAPHINLDSWMANLFRSDRPSSGVIEWYIERKARCINQIWFVAEEIIRTQSDVILELGLIQRLDRQAIYARAQECGQELHIYVIDAPREIRRKRVHKRNLEQGDTFHMEVPDDVFEIASNMWQEPDEIECSEQNIEFIDSAVVNFNS